MTDSARGPSVGSLVFWHFARRLGPWLVAMAAYLVVATLIIRWDMRRVREPVDDFGADLYGMYTQIFFEPTRSLPHSPIARLVMWITPLFGAGLLARGVVRVGGSLFDVGERRKLWMKIMTDRMKGHIVVCGLGHVGVRVVESLRDLGASVVAIEQSRSASFAEQVEASGVPVLYGDARRDELLVEAGIRRAKAVVCATDDDLVNLEVAIDAKKENPAIRVVMRMFDQRMAGKMRSALELDETFSTSAVAAPLVALQATEAGVLGVYRVEGGMTRVTMEIPVPESWPGMTVAQCEDAIDGRVVAIRRDGAPVARPRHDTKLAAADVVTLDVPAENIARLREHASERS